MMYNPSLLTESIAFLKSIITVVLFHYTPTLFQDLTNVNICGVIKLKWMRW